MGNDISPTKKLTAEQQRIRQLELENQQLRQDVRSGVPRARSPAESEAAGFPVDSS